MHAVGSRHGASQVSLRASSPAQRSLIRINYLSESSSSTAVSGVQSGQAVFLTADGAAAVEACRAA